MDIQRFCLKFFIHAGQVDEAAFIPIFHEWIRLKKLPDTLIDVADYRHVPDGPGIMLISHEVNYAMDHAGGQFGLSGQRKLGEGQSHAERILHLAKRLAQFSSQLEKDPRMAGQLRVEGGTFLYQANDRLQVPNTEAAFNAIKPHLEAAATQLYSGQAVSITRVKNDPRDRLSVLIETASSREISSLV